MEDLEKVINGGYCIGCGACTMGLLDSGIKIKLDSLGFLQANAINGLGRDSRSAAVCPFSDTSTDEDKISGALLEFPATVRDPRIGAYLNIYAGYVETGDFRGRGSSGGFTSWVLAELLRRDLVDGVIHVKVRIPDEDDKRLFHYGVSRTVEELQGGAKSHYYPVELSEMLHYIRSTPGRYAVVGLPCFIKAIRLLGKEESIFRERIRFTVGLFCGHLKSTGFAEMLAWQVGVRPDQLTAFDFRTKLANRKSSNYGVTATGLIDGEEVERTGVVSDLVGTDWGMGFFKYRACDFCDDISAETADVSVGDAWLPEFVEDSRGTNVVIVRHPDIQLLVEEGISSGVLALKPIASERAVESQSANFRHRREDLPYRLHLQDLAREWRPKKRLSPSPLRDKHRRVVQDKRIHFQMTVPHLWRRAVASGSLSHFIREIDPMIQSYKAEYARRRNPTFLQRLESKMRLIIRRLGLVKKS